MRTKTLILWLLLSVTIPSFAYDAFQSGDLYYDITSDSTVAVASGDYSELTSVIIPEAVTYNDNTYSVTSISYYAFQNCSGLTSVTIPNSVTTIEWNAFDGCTGLTSITIPNSVTSISSNAFQNCSGLTSITVPNSVTSIYNSAFDGVLNVVYSGIATGSPWGAKAVNGYVEGCLVYSDATKTTLLGCSSYVTGVITIPNSVINIGESAFSGCNNIESVIIPGSVTSIGDWAFSGCTNLTSVTIPNSVTTIEDFAFAYCPSLTSITVPNSVTSIDETAFNGVLNVVYSGIAIGSPWGAKAVNGYVEGCLVYSDATKTTLLGCSSYVTGVITIPNSVINIGKSAFSGCYDIESVIIPGSVTSIGSYAFYNCTGLTSITIPNSVTSIGSYAFYNCTGLTSITIPNSVTSIGDRTFFNCTGLTSITVSNSVSTVGTDAFVGTPWYDNLPNGVVYINNMLYAYKGTMPQGTSIVVKEGTTTVNSFAFSDCSGLTSVTIPNSVTTIEGNAFDGCTGLTSITIPNSVTSIRGYAFDGCTGLTSVTIGNSVTWLGGYAFRDCSSITSVIWNAKECDCDYQSPFSDAKANITSFTFGKEVDSIPNYLCYGMDKLTSITIPNSVTSIGSSAFQGCTGLTSVTIGNSVTNIGREAFRGCNNLTSVIWNAKRCEGWDSDFAAPFSGAKANITSFTFGNEVDSIPNYLCSGMNKLTSVTIGNSVTSIGSYAFDGCTGLTKTNYTGSIADWCKITFAGYSSTPVYYSHNLFINDVLVTDLIIPEGRTELNSYAFYGCKSLTSVSIPNSVTTIGDYAFGECEGLTTVTIGNSVTSIGENAFDGCSGLTSVTIPNSVTSIGNDAFYEVFCVMYAGTATGAPWGARSVNGYIDGYLVYSDSTKTTLLACSNEAIGEITIPNSVTNIKEGTFINCSGITSVTIPNSVKSIKENTFYDCSGLTSVSIPNSIVSIGNYAFAGCIGLTSINIPNSVRSIGICAFSSTGLTSINIPNSVQSIGMYAFTSASLTSITIGNHVTSIGDFAFDGCKSLTSVTCYATEPPTINNGNSFCDTNMDSIPLYVPAESIDKYAATDVWKDFKEIKAISATSAEAEEPILEPEENKVIITWPAADDAATYTIEISKDGTPVCTLTFDANGLLQSMRFAAPARYATQNATQAEATNNGFRFVVEDLDAATTYTYSITVTDKNETVLATYDGTFTTKSTMDTGTENVLPTPSHIVTRKIFRDGQVYIIRGDKTYSLQGAEVKR